MGVPPRSSLFFKGVFWVVSFSSVIISSFELLLGLSGSLILSLTFIKVSEIFFPLILLGKRYLSINTVVTLAPGLEILDRLGLSLLTFISFGYSMLIILSDKLADEIDLDLFIYFTVYSVSVL